MEEPEFIVMYYSNLNDHGRRTNLLAGVPDAAATVVCCGLRCAKQRCCEVLHVVCCSSACVIVIIMVLYLSLYPVPNNTTSAASDYIPD
jgi:hypothetical protein